MFYDQIINLVTELYTNNNINISNIQKKYYYYYYYDWVIYDNQIFDISQ